MQLSDTAFAAIDVPDSTPAERTIESNAINVGRFVPDHFAVSPSPPPPVFQAACPGGFTYIGQAFNYLTPPIVTVTAQDSNGNTTTFYADSWWQITNASLTGKQYTAVTGSLDASGVPGTDPVITPGTLGVGTLTFNSGSGLLFTRSAAPADPFDAQISLSINVIDADGVAATSNPFAFSNMAFNNGAKMRYGRVRIRTAVGSELVDLPVTMTAEYYNGAGAGFVLNGEDTCTTGVQLTLSGYTKNLSAGETCVRDSGSPGSSGSGCAAAAPVGMRFNEPPVGGAFKLILAAPGAGNSGSVLITGAVPAWLQYDWNGATPGDENPVGQATFGVFGGESKQIYTRELY
jgi:MSHA biogenesis protein MshQ